MTARYLAVGRRIYRQLRPDQRMPVCDVADNLDPAEVAALLEQGERAADLLAAADKVAALPWPASARTLVADLLAEALAAAGGGRPSETRAAP